MMKNKKVWLFPLAVMMAIWFFSAKPADESALMSGQLTEIILRFLKIVFPGLTPAAWFGFLNHTVRKLAHMTEFLILFGSLVFAMGKNDIRMKSLKAFGLTFLYACSDEYHQTFVSGRHGCVEDMVIDCIIPLMLTLIGLAVWGVDFEDKKIKK